MSEIQISDDMSLWYLDVHEKYPTWVYTGETELEIVIDYPHLSTSFKWSIVDTDNKQAYSGSSQTFSKAVSDIQRELWKL